MRLGKSDIFIDLCVQREYLDAGSPARCENADRIVNNIKHLMAFARLLKVPTLSCIDVDRGNRIGGEFTTIPHLASPHLHKPTYALLHDHVTCESDNCLSVSLDLLENVQQAIFTKVHHDPFTNPKLERLLTEMPARRFVIFGLPLESSIRLTVLGLMRRRRNVAIVADACGWLHREEGEMALRQLSVKGCEMLSVNSYLARGLANARVRVRADRSVA